MYKKNRFQFVLITALILSACAGTETPAAVSPVAESSPTADVCSQANLPSQVTLVHDTTRIFDDYATLASNTPKEQLLEIIPTMQAVRRDAESQTVPSCLTALKTLQVNYMNIVLETLMAFLNNQDLELVNQGIAISRDIHNQYDLEVARLLGVTFVPPTANSETSTPAQPALTDTPVSTATEPTGLTVVNNSPAGVNLRALPDVNSQQVGTLDVGQSASVIGQSADYLWVKIVLSNGQTGWVYKGLIAVIGDQNNLPILS